ADATVVLGRVGVGVEERPLEDAGGEADLVGARVVVGVDGLRQHEPLVTVHRGADLVQLPVVLESGCRLGVVPEVVWADVDRRAAWRSARSRTVGGRSTRPTSPPCRRSPRPSCATGTTARTTPGRPACGGCRP